MLFAPKIPIVLFGISVDCALRWGSVGAPRSNSVFAMLANIGPSCRLTSMTEVASSWTFRRFHRSSAVPPMGSAPAFPCSTDAETALSSGKSPRGGREKAGVARIRPAGVAGIRPGAPGTSWVSGGSSSNTSGISSSGGFGTGCLSSSEDGGGGGGPAFSGYFVCRVGSQIIDRIMGVIGILSGSRP